MTDFEFSKIIIWTWFGGFISGVNPIVLTIITIEIINKVGNYDR